MTERVGLLGWPVEHSVSPAMHNAAFEALGLDWRYDLLPVPPGEVESELPRLVDEGYRGFNVTVPHKQVALALAGDCSQRARDIGAANVLRVDGDLKLHADNTDAPGFWEDLRENGAANPPGDALIMGTGGSARAVTVALVAGDWRVHVLSRDDARAAAFAKAWASEKVTALPRTDLEATAPRLALIVNCTPLGMWPHVGASPWPQEVPIAASATVYDLVYNPAHTTLMAQAEAADARALGGLGMLARQAALAFEIWTGHAPPPGVMRATAEQALTQRQ